MTTRAMIVIFQTILLAVLVPGSRAAPAQEVEVERTQPPLAEPIPNFEHVQPYVYRDLVLRYPLPEDGFTRHIPLAEPSPDAYTQLISDGVFAALGIAQEGPRPPDGPAEPRIWQRGNREYDLDYTHDDTDLRGFIVEPGGGELRGTVLIVHAWKGLGDEEKERARMIARLGYRAFAIDMYGQGVRAEDNEEASKLAGTYYADRQLMRGRVRAAIDALKNEGKLTDNLAAIGYCFGGTVVLECARHGMDLDAVVSFHGGLTFESAPRRGQVTASVLVCNGYADPYVSMEDRQDFKREMQQAGADFVFIDYADAVHSFTSKAAGEPAEGKGAAYDEKADERSWRAMRDWFEQAMPN